MPDARPSPPAEPDTLEISAPRARYELLAALTVQALTEEAGGSAAEQARELARQFGHDLGKQANGGTGEPRPQLREAIGGVLSACGYEPKGVGQRDVRLHNCPFASLAAQYRSTVCQMNLALHEGLLEGLGASGQLRAELQPAPGRCCVTLVEVSGS